MDNIIAPKIENPRQEIQAFKEKISRFESEYQKKDVHKEKLEIVKEALAEHLEETKELAGESYKISEEELRHHASDISEIKSEQEQLAALFEITAKKGPLYAFNVAKNLKNSHLFDLFHAEFIKRHDELLG